MIRIQKVVYLYRDAGNYKFWGEFYVAGELSIEELRPHLFHGEYFVPEKVGIPALVPESRNDDDHMLHELESIEIADASPYLFTSSELINCFRAANASGWFSGPF
ncbi:MAG TPA: hypothetical protein VGT78_02935 [Rhizomicrobium sp.]|nr:hypothetical protein [Rhizomicrobium sp.]